MLNRDSTPHLIVRQGCSLGLDTVSRRSFQTSRSHLGLIAHRFTYLLQYKCMSDRDVIPATTLCTQSQAQRPPSPADHNLLSSNTTSGGLIDPVVPSNSNKLKLFDFMSTQPRRKEAPKNKQPDVSRDLQHLRNCSAVGLDAFNDPSFATSLRPIAMMLFCAPCSLAASERVFSRQ